MQCIKLLKSKPCISSVTESCRDTEQRLSRSKCTINCGKHLQLMIFRARPPRREGGRGIRLHFIYFLYYLKNLSGTERDKIYPMLYFE